MLFAGTDGGTEHWGIIASLIETCNLKDVDQLTCLIDARTKIVNGHANCEINQPPVVYEHQDLKAAGPKTALP